MIRVLKPNKYLLPRTLIHVPRWNVAGLPALAYSWCFTKDLVANLGFELN